MPEKIVTSTEQQNAYKKIVNLGASVIAFKKPYTSDISLKHRHWITSLAKCSSIDIKSFHF